MYNPGGNDAEKYHILMEDDKKNLNVKLELLSKCRHEESEPNGNWTK